MNFHAQNMSQRMTKIYSDDTLKRVHTKVSSLSFSDESMESEIKK